MGYHLRTLGSILLLTALVMLLAAVVGLTAGNAFNRSTDGGTVPGRGVTPIPTPVWSPQSIDERMARIGEVDCRYLPPAPRLAPFAPMSPDGIRRR